jgi:hypothetical protein
MTLYTGVLSALWLSGLLGPTAWSGIASGWTVLGSVLGSWVGTFLSSRSG